MSRTLTPQKMPVAIDGKTKISSSSDLQIFLSAALGMSWKLAIAVLVPVLGGYELDKHLGTTPVFTILGLIITMVLCVVVMSTTLKPYMPDNNRGNK